MDRKSKKKKVNSIKNEVKEFHPLLDKLFRKLPNIQAVEYRHGNNEKGADFILTSRHEVLGHLKYIGTIVKIGEIDKNLRNIEDQIDDCRLERYIVNGKDKIRIDEIWIVTNDKITDPAKEKIFEKFTKSSVFFMSDVDIIGFIDTHLPNYWYEIPISLGEYLNSLNNRNDEIDKSSCFANIEDKGFYVDQEVIRSNKSYSKQKNISRKREEVNIINEILFSNISFIEGSMGSGKSKLIRKIIEKFSSPEFYIQHKILPINTTFKEVVDVYKLDLDSLIKEKIKSIDLKEIGADTTYLLLIDGVDEKKADVDEQLDLVGQLISKLKANNKLKALITSRYLHFDDVNKNILNNTNRLELIPLTPKKVILFINKICSSIDISKRLFEDLKKSLLFKELQHSPIGVILLAKLINENNTDLPQNMTELYSKYTELVLGRWDIEKKLQTSKEYEVAEILMMILAEYIIDNDILWLNIDEAIEKLNEYLALRNLGINGNELFEKILKRSEILELDNSGRSVKFKHKAFAEFFYAKKNLRNINFKVDERVFSVYWGNIFFFYIGLQKDCPELLEQIVNINPSEEIHRWMKLVNMGNLFLAGYQSPFSVFKKNFHKIINEGTALYLDIIDKKSNSPLNQFSELDLLCLIQGLIRESYSYKFFEKLLEDSCIMIEDNHSLSDREKIYSLFFMSVIGMELENGDPFDFLLEKYGKNLPQPIELAVRYEAKKIKEQSQLLKGLFKRVTRNLRTNKSYNISATNLHERSIISTKKGP
jgi:hypothetical protein